MSSSSQNNLSGLPKLPKVLSTIANAANDQWKESGKVYATQIEMTVEDNLSKTVNTKAQTDHAKSISVTLAQLRRDMSFLRLLDGSLYCQLMSLNAAIAELREAQEEQYQLFSESSDMILEEYDEDLETGIISNGTISII